MNHSKITAIVLAAGQGRRMNSSVQKQYMMLENKPVLFYALNEFQNSQVDEIILVVGKGEIPFCKNTIIDEYGFSKVTKLIEGGEERYQSVHLALQAIDKADYVLIHDGARPLINQDIIQKSIDTVMIEKACVVGMPVKDTIKVVDTQCYAKDTPKRSSLWLVQTPQSFSYTLIKESYERLISSDNRDATDDAMVVEQYGNHNVKLIEGSYQNIKITTPEDLCVATVFMNNRYR